MVTANGKPAVLLNINRQPESNTLQVANEVHTLIQELASTLPPGVHLEPFYDQSTIVHDSIASVRDAVLVGILLSSIILVLFLRDWGTSLVAGLVIPVTLFVTFIVLKVTGQSFNLMTLGGLAAAVGLVIDDAIVVLENIVLHRDAGQNRFLAIQSALRELTVPLIGSTITPMVVFLPLVSITGVTGSFFRALAVTMTVSLFTSLVLALTWTPTLSLYLVRREAKGQNEGPATERGDAAALLVEEESQKSGVFGRIIAFYSRVMQIVLKKPWTLVAGSIAVVLLAVLCFGLLDTELLPGMDEGGFILDYFTPPGSSLAESNRILNHIEQILRSTPEVETTSRRTGLQLGLAAVTEANNGDFTVKLKSKRDRDVEEVIADVRAKIEEEEPAIKVEFVQLLQDMIGDLTSQPEPIVIKLFAQDGNLLNATAPRVADAISKAPGVVDVLNGVENTVSGPTVTYQVNSAVAVRAGFTPEEIAVDASAILEGEPAAAPAVVGDRSYAIRVRFPEQNRSSLEQMGNTLLTSATGHTATLGSLATIVNDPGETEIRRENLQRTVQITGRFEGVGLGNGMKAVKKVVSGLGLPSSIRVEYGGQYEEQQKSFNDLLFVLVLALLLAIRRAVVRVQNIFRAVVDFDLCAAVDFRRITRTPDHKKYIQRGFVYGNDHGHRHRCQERHFAPGRRAGLSPSRLFPRGRDDPGRTPPVAAHSDDRSGNHRGHAAPGVRHWFGIPDATASRDRGGRRVVEFHGSFADPHSGHELLPAKTRAPAPIIQGGPDVCRLQNQRGGVLLHSWLFQGGAGACLGITQVADPVRVR